MRVAVFDVPARRRYLAVDPANQLVADTLEADWNTALRALTQAQDAASELGVSTGTVKPLVNRWVH